MPKKTKKIGDKHKISFELAQYVFADPDRVIAEDLNHSQKGKTILLFW